MRGRTDPAAGDRSGRRRRGCPRPGHGGDRQCGVRCARRARAQSADHARQSDRRHGIGFMTSAEHPERRRGARPGRKPRAEIQGADRLRHRGRVRRGRRHGRKIAQGHAGRHRHSDGGDRGGVGGGETGGRRVDRRYRPGRDRRRRPRRRSPGRGQRCRGPARGLLAADAIFVPDTKASTAGIHVAKVLAQLGIADEVAARLKIFPNGATAMRELAASDAPQTDRLHAVDRDHQHQGVMLSGSLPPGCELSTMYTAASTTQAAHARQAQDLIDLLTGIEQRELRERAGFLYREVIRLLVIPRQPRATCAASRRDWP